MNRETAVRHLSDYCALVKKAQRLPVLSKERRTTMKAVNEQVDLVNHCLRNIAPDFEPINAYYLPAHASSGLPRAYRALELIEAWGKMASGEWTAGGPALPLAVLEPVISSAAKHLWDTGKYRLAVAEAASGLSYLTQCRTGRHDISDKDLMAQAFSEKDPEEGKPRLRCPGDHGSITVRSMQQGALLMSQGCFQAIRNPAHHLSGDWNPVTAAEHLAVLSVVARWVRDWDLVRYVPPVPDYGTIRAAIEAQSRPALTQQSG